MQQSYDISGMTCSGCTQIVQDTLLAVEGVTKVVVELSTAKAVIETVNVIPIEQLQTAFAGSMYQIYERAPTDNKQDTPFDDRSEKNKKLVLDYLNLVGGLQYEQLYKYLHADFAFNGEIRFKSASDFIKMIKEHALSPVAAILLKYDVKAIFENEGECCVIYDLITSFPGVTVPVTESITIKDDKLQSTVVKINRARMKQLMQEIGKAKTNDKKQ